MKLRYPHPNDSREMLQSIMYGNAAVEGMPTPLIHCEPLSRELGCPVYFKMDSLAPTGSYADRAALHVVRESLGTSTVFTCASTGNHGIAVASAAQAAGRPWLVALPKQVSLTKLAKLRAVPSRPARETDNVEDAVAALERGESVILIVEGVFDDAVSAAQTVSGRLGGARFIHPYNDPDGFFGHASIGAELDLQLGQLGLEDARVRLVFPSASGFYGTSAVHGCRVCGLDAHVTLCELGPDGPPAYIPQRGFSSLLSSPERLGLYGGTSSRRSAITLVMSRAVEAECVKVERGAIVPALGRFYQSIRQEIPESITTEPLVGLAIAGLMRAPRPDDDVVVVGISGGNASRADLQTVIKKLPSV